MKSIFEIRETLFIFFTFFHGSGIFNFTVGILIRRTLPKIQINYKSPKLFSDADTGSSKPQSTSVKVQRVTKFTWPKNFYPGSLISVSSKFIAYVIRGKSDAGKSLQDPYPETFLSIFFFGNSVSVILGK